VVQKGEVPCPERAECLAHLAEVLLVEVYLAIEEVYLAVGGRDFGQPYEAVFMPV
jgi:hypothetical protein